MKRAWPIASGRWTRVFPKAMACAIPALFSGCAEPGAKVPGPTVTEAFGRDPARHPAPAVEPEPADSARRASADGDPPVALFEGGGAILRSQLAEVLLRIHGATFIDELVVQVRAEQLARRRGLVLRQEDVDREYQTILADMADPLASITGAAPDREQAERILLAVLSERNSTMEEFRLAVRRNALLRRIIEPEIAVSEEEVQQEIGRLTGPRVQVRHVQVATLAQAQAVLAELRAGTAFADVVARFSGNPATAARGGRLEPFAREDPRVPAALREAAFVLQPGQVSDAIRVGHWYHVIMGDERLAPEADNVAGLREQARARLAKAKQDEALPRLYNRLLEEANVVVLDPELREQYEARRGRRGG